LHHCRLIWQFARVIPSSARSALQKGRSGVTQQRRMELAGAASMELVSGVVQLRPEDAMVEAMLRGWRA
jgi:hypothetical protein